MKNIFPTLSLLLAVALGSTNTVSDQSHVCVGGEPDQAAAVNEIVAVKQGATVNWWVTNTASKPAVVTIWKTTRTLNPGQRASFAYAIHSKLWVTVKDANGNQTYSKKHSWDLIPNNHECVVNKDLSFTDLGKDKNGKPIEWLVKAAAEAARKWAGG